MRDPDKGDGLTRVFSQIHSTMLPNIDFTADQEIGLKHNTNPFGLYDP